MKVVISWPNPPAWVVALAGPVRRTTTADAALEVAEKRERLKARMAQVPYYREGAAASSTPLHHLLDRSAQFLRPRSQPLRPGFRSPLPGAKVTIVGAPIEPNRNVSVLPASQWQRLHLSKVSLLAATPTVLRQVVACVECSLMALPKLHDGIVVLNSVENGLLRPGERDMLWRCFGLPVFEQWLGLEGELLAHECAVHQGLHLNTNAADFEWRDGQLLVTSLLARQWITHRLETGWTGEIDTRPCPCGDSRPRLRGLTTWTASRVACAASAVA
jgi:hypothetical protein